MTNLTGFVSSLNSFNQALEAIQNTSRTFGSTVSTLSSTVSQTKSVFAGDSYLASTDAVQTSTDAPAETYSESEATASPAIEAPSAPTSQAPVSETQAAANYPVNGYTSQTQDWRISMDQLSLSRVGTLLAHAGAGAAVANKFSGAVAGDIRDIFSATAPLAQHSPLQGLKGLGLNLVKGSAVSALVSLGFSSLVNGFGVVTGKVSVKDAGTQVLKDGIGGAVGGLTAVAAGGLGQLLLGRTGTFGLIASVALGAVGGVAGGQLAAQWTQNLNVGQNVGQ